MTTTVGPKYVYRVNASDAAAQRVEELILLAPPAVRSLFHFSKVSDAPTDYSSMTCNYPTSGAAAYARDALADEMAAYAATRPRAAYTFLYNPDVEEDSELVRAIRTSPPPVACLFLLSKALPAGVPCTLYDNGVPTCGEAARAASRLILLAEMERQFPHGLGDAPSWVLVCSGSTAERVKEITTIRASAALSAQCIVATYADEFKPLLYSKRNGAAWTLWGAMCLDDLAGVLQRQMIGPETPHVVIPAVPDSVPALVIPAPASAIPDAARRMLRCLLSAARWEVSIDGSNPAEMDFLAAVPAEWLRTVVVKLVQPDARPDVCRIRAQVYDKGSGMHGVTKTELLELMAFAAARS